MTLVEIVPQIKRLDSSISQLPTQVAGIRDGLTTLRNRVAQVSEALLYKNSHPQLLLYSENNSFFATQLTEGSVLYPINTRYAADHSLARISSLADIERLLHQGYEFNYSSGQYFIQRGLRGGMMSQKAVILRELKECEDLLKSSGRSALGGKNYTRIINAMRRADEAGIDEAFSIIANISSRANNIDPSRSSDICSCATECIKHLREVRRNRQSSQGPSANNTTILQELNECKRLRIEGKGRNNPLEQVQSRIESSVKESASAGLVEAIPLIIEIQNRAIIEGIMTTKQTITFACQQINSTCLTAITALAEIQFEKAGSKVTEKDPILQELAKLKEIPLDKGSEQIKGVFAKIRSIIARAVEAGIVEAIPILSELKSDIQSRYVQEPRGLKSHYICDFCDRAIAKLEELSQKSEAAASST